MATAAKKSKEKSVPLARVDNNANVPNDPKSLVGRFAKVTSGDDKGAYGVVLSVVERDENSVPTRVTFRTRDDENRSFDVDYDALEGAGPGLR